MDNTCKNCDYWSRVTPKKLPEDFGKCYCEAKFIYDRAIGTPEERFHEKDVFALYCKDSNDHGSFATGQDFGCIHFKNEELEKLRQAISKPIEGIQPVNELPCSLREYCDYSDECTTLFKIEKTEDILKQNYSKPGKEMLDCYCEMRR